MVGKAIPSTGTIISNDAHGISCNNINNLTDCDDETLQIKHPYYLRAKQSRIVHKERIAPLRSSPDDDYGGLRDEEEDLTDCFVMPSNNSCDAYGCNNVNGDSKGKQVADKDHLFQCKACKKVFGSHQALGGHRASHKKVKGCYAAKVDEQNDNDEDDEDFESLSYESDLEPIGTEHCERAKLKMHECSVCRRVFSSGQALGGHKRCHWLTNSSDNSFVPSFHDFQNLPRLNLCLDQCLDLNLKLTAPSLDDQESTRLYLQQLKEKIEGGEDEGHNKGCEKLMRNLSELNDLNPTDEGWLQVGISSAADSRN